MHAWVSLNDALPLRARESEARAYGRTSRIPSAQMLHRQQPAHPRGNRRGTVSDNDPSYTTLPGTPVRTLPFLALIFVPMILNPRQLLRCYEPFIRYALFIHYWNSGSGFSIRWYSSRS